MTAYTFFFSYARADCDEYLDRFFKDLSGRIRQQLGLGREKKVGFFDQPEIELGTDWLEELNGELQSCPVLVSLYSPAYFRSPYCGKEWEVFRRRRELYVNLQRQAGNQDVRLPPVIKPVIWVPLMENQQAPDAVSGPQYFMGDPMEDHNRVGLLRMRRQHRNFEDSYELFIDRLKKEIIDVAREVELPRLVNFEGLDKMESAFHPATPVPAGAASITSIPPGTTHKKGPMFVRFVFIAGDPDQFPKGARAREFYLQSGGREWMPYYPEYSSPIMLQAQRVAADLEILSDELHFSENLAEEVRQAERDGSMVIVFVDSWTAELTPYRQTLSSFDEKHYFNCSIFVPWNEKDPQTAGRQEDLRRMLRNEIFPRWSQTRQPIFFRDEIKSIGDLMTQLKDTLRQLQPLVGMGLMETATRESIPRRIETDITRPILSHR